MITILLKFPDKSFRPFSSVSKVHKKTNTCPPKTLLEPEDYSLSFSPCPLTLHDVFTKSDCIFFIRYIPENILKPC